MISIVQLKEKQSAYSLLLVLGASLFIALCAQIRIPLPFTPIPITGHTLGVMLVGATLGSTLGFWAVCAYLLEILIGLPIRGGDGIVGPLAFFGPAGGYFLAMPLQAYFAGKVNPNLFHSFFWLAVGCAINLLFGAAWLAYFVGWNHALAMGITPFIPGEIIKSILVTLICKFEHGLCNTIKDD